MFVIIKQANNYFCFNPKLNLNITEYIRMNIAGFMDPQFKFLLCQKNCCIESSTKCLEICMSGLPL